MGDPWGSKKSHRLSNQIFVSLRVVPGLGLGTRGLLMLAFFVWRWRLLLGGDALWMLVFMPKYGQAIRSMTYYHNLAIPPSTSVWWKDLCRIGGWGDEGGDWISENSKIKVGIANSTRF